MNVHIFRFLPLTFVIVFFITNVHAIETGPLGFGSPELSQDMETDRPDFTEGPSTISPGHFQLEAGYLFTYNDDDGRRSREHVSPQLLARVGLLSDLELRISWDGYLDSKTTVDDASVSENTVNGVSDLNLGLKHRLYEAGSDTPDVSIIIQASVPSGSSDVSSHDTEPEVKLIWARSFCESWALAGNINFASPVLDDKRYFETSTSVTLAHSLTEKIGTYLEYFAFFPNSSAPDSSGSHFINGGFTYGFSNVLQFDVLLGAGLNEEADDLFSGLGVAYRH